MDTGHNPASTFDPFFCVIVDKSQDLSEPQFRIKGRTPDTCFLHLVEEYV